MNDGLSNVTSLEAARRARKAAAGSTAVSARPLSRVRMAMIAAAAVIIWLVISYLRGGFSL